MKKNHRIRQVAGACMALVLVVVWASFCQAAPKKTVLKAVTAWPKTTWEAGNFTKFMEIVKANVDKKHPGELEIQYLGGPEVTPSNEQVEAARMGVVDMVFTTDGYYVSAVPEVNALSVSVLDGWEERAKGVNAFLDKLHNEKVNCTYLGRLGHNLPFVLYLNKPIKTADLTGLKIRCSPTNIGFIKKLGGQPVVIPPTEVYTALERGVVDGYVFPAALITDWGWEKLTKYIVNPGFYNGANVVLVNKKKWDGLSEPLRKTLIESEDEAARFAKQRTLDRIKEAEGTFKKLGIQYIDLSPAESKKLVDAAYDALWEIIIGKSPVDGPKLREMVSKK